MADVFGTGEFLYTHVADWEKLPDGMTFKECPGVAVHSSEWPWTLPDVSQKTLSLNWSAECVKTP